MKFECRQLAILACSYLLAATALAALRFPTQGSPLIVGVRNLVRPIHLFDPDCDHDYYFELPLRRRAGYQKHYAGDLLHLQQNRLNAHRDRVSHDRCLRVASQ